MHVSHKLRWNKSCLTSWPAVPGVGNLLLIFCPAAGHFHVFLIPAPGNLTHIFENCQKPGGGIGTLGFDWCIKCKFLEAWFCANHSYHILVQIKAITEWLVSFVADTAFCPAILIMVALIGQWLIFEYIMTLIKAQAYNKRDKAKYIARPSYDNTYLYLKLRASSWIAKGAAQAWVTLWLMYELQWRDQLGAVYMRVGTGRIHPGFRSCLHDPALPGRDVRWDDFDILK